jgi:type I restriction enzyme, S subunit
MAATKNTKPFYNTEIPSDWEELKLKNIGKITSGTTPLRSNLDYHTGGTIPWVKTTDLNNSLILETEEKITEFALQETSLRIYPKQTVLVAMYGGFNQIGRTGILGIEATINQALSAITIDKNEVDPIYLLNWLNAKVGHWKNLAGSSRKDPNINSKDVGDFPFIKPPLPEQKAIAQVLSTADAAIHTTEKLIAQKELRKKWLMQQLLTGKKRLKGFSREWKEVEVSQLVNQVYRYVDWNEDELYQLISIRRRNGGVFFREPLLGYQIGVKKLKTIFVDDFVISKRQVSHGAWAVVDEQFSGAKISDEYDCLEISNNSMLVANFWKWYCQIPKLTHFANVDSDGVHIEKSIFDFDLFKRRKVRIPTSIEEQTTIAQVLQAADKEISLLKAKAEKLREQKKGLMQVLLTGKIRLNQNLEN